MTVETLVPLIGTVITGLVTLTGVIITNKASGDKIQADMKIHQAVIENELKNIERRLDENEELVNQVPRIDERVRNLEKRF
ncbi:MAG TPA: hypothetical protein DD377_01220, partial [Firmicutes bacterium]|nr:hypothetical protein [Bacillota bacterium]